ncbi:MAG TPA: class II aldolase/adducin family protein [Candidatus Sumerlaeota bacterium]|nr:class II aldolase/adducin family protein [Candidatus Sumerlaeota bacterium]
MLNEWQAKDTLCEIGRRIWQRGYVAANDGNLSCRVGKDLVVATPTMVSKGFMNPGDMVSVDLEGRQVGGSLKPTSELKVHLNIYRSRPDVFSVVHCHPPHATAFCVARRQLPKCVLPEVEILLGQIPIVPYATPGTEEFARSIDPWIQTHVAFLMANHGTITLGADPLEAYYRTETLDQYCRVLILAAGIGDWQMLDYSSMNDIFRIRETLGLKDSRSLEQGLCEVCRPGVEPDSKPATPPIPDRGIVEDIVRDILKEKGLLP